MRPHLCLPDPFGFHVLILPFVVASFHCFFKAYVLTRLMYYVHSTQVMNVYHAMRAVHDLVDKARVVLKKRNATARLLAAKSKDILSHPRWEVLIIGSILLGVICSLRCRYH